MSLALPEPARPFFKLSFVPLRNIHECFGILVARKVSFLSLPILRHIRLVDPGNLEIYL